MEDNVIRRKWEQGKGVRVDNIGFISFTGEYAAHTFEIYAVDPDGQQKILNGTVTAKFWNKNTNVTVPLDGVIVNGAASVTLHTSCYVDPGLFLLTIYYTSDETQTVIYAGVGSVVTTQSDTVAYPTAAIPDVADLIQEVQDVIDSIPQDYTTLNTSVSNMKAAVVGANTANQDTIEWIRGGLNSSNGASTTANASKRCRTNGVLINGQTVTTDGLARIYVYFYSGSIETSSFLGHTGGWLQVCDLEDYKAKHYPTADRIRMVGSKIDDSTIGDGSSSDVTECSDHIFVVGKLARMSDQPLLYKSPALANTTDFNDVVNNGMYQCGNADSGTVETYHRPTVMYGVLCVMPANNATRLAQIFISGDNRLYHRIRYSGTWTEWEYAGTGKDTIRAFIEKGSWGADGNRRYNVDALCYSQILNLKVGSSLEFYLDPGWTYTIREGNAPTILTRTAHLSTDRIHIVTMPYVAIYFNKFVNGESINLTVDDFHNSVIVRTSGDAIEKAVETEIHDMPENVGQLNVVYRAYQLSKAQYTTLATLPLHSGGSTTVTIRDAPADTAIDGIPYSSMRETMASIPQATSFHTFMTAILNPNSYLYTKHYEQSAPGYDYNSRCYYGAVCSTLVAYAYGIDNVIPTTISFANYPGLNPLPESQQSPQYLKLADMLNKAGDHIVIVTDIIRNYRGRIETIEVTEAWKPLFRTLRYTPAQIQSEYFDNDFVAYRYENVDDVPYTPDPWIHVDETETADPVYTAELSPRKGDKANWSVGETIEIDVLDVEGYTGYAVKNLGTGSTVTTGTIPSGNVISLSNLSAGKYEAYLTGESNSGSVYFDIIDMSVSYTALGNHQVRVQYSSAMGTPSAVYWCCNNVSSSDYKAVRAYHILTDAEIEAGYAVVDEPTEHRAADTANGVWLMRMCFKTEFGLYASELTAVSVA